MIGFILRYCHGDFHAGTIFANRKWVVIILGEGKSNASFYVENDKYILGGYAVKNILLIGELESKDAFIDELKSEGDYRIRMTNNPAKALRLLKRDNPDYFICTGKMKATKDGKYFLELEN